MNAVEAGLQFEDDRSGSLYYSRYAIPVGGIEAQLLSQLVASWGEKNEQMRGDVYQIILFANSEPVARIVQKGGYPTVWVDIVYPIENPSLLVAHRQSVLWQIQKQQLGWL